MSRSGGCRQRGRTAGLPQRAVARRLVARIAFIPYLTQYIYLFLLKIDGLVHSLKFRSLPKVGSACRLTVGPRPYTLGGLDAAAGMSISGVRTAYSHRDVAQVACLAGPGVERNPHSPPTATVLTSAPASRLHGRGLSGTPLKPANRDRPEERALRADHGLSSPTKRRLRRRG